MMNAICATTVPVRAWLHWFIESKRLYTSWQEEKSVLSNKAVWLSNENKLDKECS